jgi:excisionase family DNA binding protein
LEAAVEPLEPLLYRVTDVAALLAISPNKVYQLVKDKRLHSVRVGGAIRIPATAVMDYLASLQPAPVEAAPEAVAP